MSSSALFDDFFLGGFECSCHALEDGRRLDLTASTRHLEFVDRDYMRLRTIGITSCRDGISWVRAARAGESYSFADFLPMVRAAERHGVLVIWDLMHFGWPDDVDVFDASFPSRFGKYAKAFAEWIACETDRPLFVAPINEMSFLAWAGGDVRCMNPFAAARGVELKSQLVRATIEAIEAIRDVVPEARFVQPEPIIHIVASHEHPKTWRRVESDELLQYQAWDMLRGDVWPSLGGHPKYLDIVGVNFYPDNQFMLDGTTIERGDVRYKPLSKMLLEVWRRYRCPMFVSETGSEGDGRAAFLRYVAKHCILAMEEGCELHGLTLYPIASHPGWLDERHCHNGLFDYADDDGHRAIHRPLLDELERQRPKLLAARAGLFDNKARSA